MYRNLRPLMLALPLAVTAPLPGQAQGYPIDCAILLCLAGSWPASAPCARAKAEFIRRLTPWPVEPPLQLWNCPMGANVITSAPAAALGSEGVQNAATDDHVPDRGVTYPATSGLDFLRSLRVWQTEYWQGETRTGCRKPDSSRLGSYDAEGRFHWQPSRIAALPTSSGIDPPARCQSYRWRAVLVEWRDHAGRYGFEELRY